MELIICFAFAVSIFISIILGVIGLVNAPTPLLACILILGIMITQKSIDGLAESEINLTENKDKTELVKENRVTSDAKETTKSMVYRGSHYVAQAHINSNNHAPKLNKLKYRGIEVENTEERNV